MKWEMAGHPDWKSLLPMPPLLAAVPEAVRKASQVMLAAEGRLLFARGDKPRAMFFVLSGEIRLVRPSRSGAEIVLQRARCGFIAEASLDQQAYHCDAVAASASEVLRIPRKAFNDALAEESFRKPWIAHLSRELRRVRAQAERLSLRTAQDRIIHFIETEGVESTLVLSQSKKDWASELGLTHEALYRALAQMQRMGLAKVEGSRIVLLHEWGKRGRQRGVPA
jgi:CRP-like cAMP-binding protein